MDEEEEAKELSGCCLFNGLKDSEESKESKDQMELVHQNFPILHNPCQLVLGFFGNLGLFRPYQRRTFPSFIKTSFRSTSPVTTFTFFAEIRTGAPDGL